MDPALGGPDLRCSACENRLRADARFCDACGASATPNLAAGERKQITVLFADVVGSMRIAAALDPERLRDIMHELFNSSAAIVQRYQGTIDKFTGDGLVALFGAPTALEDHALRACISALEIQAMVREMADRVRQRHNVNLQLRIGLNSGEVITGDIGVGPGAYTAFGHTVGMAQRMEAAADPGSVLCAESTTLLVEHAVRLGQNERVAIKGSQERVPARRLEGIDPDRIVLGRDLGPLVGRDAELAELCDAFERREATTISIVGEPGLGKSRLLREFTAVAAARGAVVVVTRCEAHTGHVPLRALSRMLRARFGIHHLDADTARQQIAEQLSEVIDRDSDEMAILFDLLSIADAAAPMPTVTADARRRRLIELLRASTEIRSARMIFAVEDLHWIDAASEEVFAGFADALTTTQSMVVGTFRPEYRGNLREMSQTTVALRPLNPSTTTALASGLLGENTASREIAEHVARSAAGNPFFVEEIVRDLVGRDLLRGNRGDYRPSGDLNAIAVPATVQAVLAARVDRLTKAEKAILNAASVIGASFSLDELRALVPDVDDSQLRNLVSTELLDQPRFLPSPRYAFRHPLVRAVCYESQLTSTRARSHRQLAKALEHRNLPAAGDDWALIAHHLEAAGDLAASYLWHMKSGDWLKNRNVAAARISWEQARATADRLPDDHPDVTAKRTAPRAQLASTGWLVADNSEQCFDELRQLTRQSGDVLSLAVGMSGWLTTLVIIEGRVRDALEMASELASLTDQIGGHGAEKAEILMAVAYAQYEGCAFDQALRTTDRLRAIPEARNDDKGPAASVAGLIKVMTGRRAEAQRDLDTGLELARSHPLSNAIVVANASDLVVLGFDTVDQRLVEVTGDALGRALTFGDAYGLALARWAHGVVLLRIGDRHVDEGVELLRLSRRDGIDTGGCITDTHLIMAMPARDDRYNQIDLLHDLVDEELDSGSVLYTSFGVSALVQLLLERGASGDLERARDVVARFESVVGGLTLPVLELCALQCRTRLAGAAGDTAGYTELVTRYRSLAKEVDARGHLVTATQLN